MSLRDKRLSGLAEKIALRDGELKKIPAKVVKDIKKLLKK